MIVMTSVDLFDSCCILCVIELMTSSKSSLPGQLYFKKDKYSPSEKLFKPGVESLLLQL
jgi:hypothetical protein